MLSSSPAVLSSDSRKLQGRLVSWLIFLYLFGAAVLLIISLLPLVEAYLPFTANFSRSLQTLKPLHPFQINTKSLEPVLIAVGIPFLVGLVYLGCGYSIFSVWRSEPVGRAFCVFAASAGIVFASHYELLRSQSLALLWCFGLGLTSGSLIHLALLFPRHTRQIERYSTLGWMGYGFAVLLGLSSWLALYHAGSSSGSAIVWMLLWVFLAVSIVIFVASSFFRLLRPSSPVVREQARLVLWGALFSLLPGMIGVALKVFLPHLSFSSYLLLPLAIFPIIFVYAGIRYRLLSSDDFLSRIILYSLMAGLAMLGYALLVSGASMLAGQTLNPTNPLLVGLMVFVIALGFHPVREYLQGTIDRFFFKGQLAFRELQQAYGRELTVSMDLVEIVAVLNKYVDLAVSPEHLHLFVFDPLSGQYGATPGSDGRLTSEIRFPGNSALVQMLSRQREALFLVKESGVSEMLHAEQARLRLLSSSLFIPLPGRNGLIGWAALGDRKSGEPYTSRDLRLLETLCDQAALAVERAQVVADLERRVRELNVLARVAQGVSFTVAFDDVLELLSAQANQILPARDFRVTLLDEESAFLSHVFYLEDDERLNEYEYRQIPVGQGLEREVLSSQRWLVTDDYEVECRQRGVFPNYRGIFAWMGVPLNAGSETIGVVSIASRDPSITYTDEQRELLQAIADQASGAIVKARSLEQAEKRARQLAMLNEVALSLTSTLEIGPLLNQILTSATEILNCEAGSLFLVDPQTDELVFEVVIGPVAADLTGKRLPPGTGLVGEAAHTGQAIIANDAKRRMEWFEQTDEQTGFNTQDLLVVPMRVHDRVIGVIEVINKTNGAPFTNADQELLTAYASQATIAIENARLYTMTDQALAARVEELSVMQRIDRELNASLDIERAMRITLDWAMRQSRMEAGLVGVVEGDEIRVMALQGYTDELSSYQSAADGKLPAIPTDLFALKEVIETGKPHYLEFAPGGGTDQSFLMKDALVQIVVPIRRETGTIGLLFLESKSRKSSPEELTGFLDRLSDHAAIAISNAQFYEEVRLANLAKSQFVSFVAHELKNPMASIKGYTELVAGGMAGPVNEMQSSFLATVRSNVDRMNTIVSDLNDLTKIQVGNMRLDYRSVQISEVLDEVIRSLTRQIEEKSQTLSIELAENLPSVWADPARLAQIITNLMSNAQKYTPENGQIVVGAERHKSSEGEQSDVEWVHLWVKDSGIGIAEEDQKKIFQQYFRTDHAKEMAAGTGLGLAITRSLVEMQGGRIWFESRANEGTTFHFTVPVAEAQ